MKKLLLCSLINVSAFIVYNNTLANETRADVVNRSGYTEITYAENKQSIILNGGEALPFSLELTVDSALSIRKYGVGSTFSYPQTLRLNGHKQQIEYERNYGNHQALKKIQIPAIEIHQTNTSWIDATQWATKLTWQNRVISFEIADQN